MSIFILLAGGPLSSGAKPRSVHSLLGSYSFLRQNLFAPNTKNS